MYKLEYYSNVLDRWLINASFDSAESVLSRYLYMTGEFTAVRVRIVRA